MKKKVLMITYSWPPRGGVGMYRTLKFAKYLPLYGWEPTILTPDDAPFQTYCSEEEGRLEGVNVVTSLYRDIFGRASNARIRVPFKSLLNIPDQHRGWIGSAVKEGIRLHQKEKFDLIFSSSPPSTTHLIAKKLKEHLGIPWVADMRDPWSDYHQDKAGGLIKHLQKKLESRTMAAADKIITVSPSFASKFKKDFKKDVEVITNGFDKDDFAEAKAGLPGRNHRFTIIYAGKIHHQYQDPCVLFDAVKELLGETRISPDRIAIDFYSFGQHMPDFNAIAKRYKLEKILYLHPPVHYKDCLAKIKSADLLLIVDWNDDSEIADGVLPVKLFDYLASRKPILAISGKRRSDLKDIIKVTGGGSVCSNKDEVRGVLEKYYNEYKEKGSISFVSREDMLEKYSRKILTAELTGVFNEISEKSGTSHGKN
jgi:glycosyltransferase involved in cell wall biosynthesis